MPSQGDSLDIPKKLEIPAQIISQEKTGNANFTSVGKKFDVDRTTVAGISKQRENLREQSHPLPSAQVYGPPVDQVLRRRLLY